MEKMLDKKSYTLRPAVTADSHGGGNVKTQLNGMWIPGQQKESPDRITKPQLAAFRARIARNKKTIWSNG